MKKQKIRYLMKTYKYWLHAKNLPNTLWIEGMACVTYIINRTLLSLINLKCTYELMFDDKPNIKYFRVFSSPCYVHIPNSKKSKLDAKAKKYIFIDYDKKKKYWAVPPPAAWKTSRSWNIRFDEAIKSYDFVKNEDEPCVYRKLSGSTITFLVLYVDNILIIGNDVGMLSTVKTWLSRHFSMKDLGEASYILGIRIYRDRSKRMLGLSQSRYIDTIIKRFGMKNSKRGLIPMRHGISLSRSMSLKTPEERTHMDMMPYASAIGSIMYAMLCTRPNIAHALSVTSRYQVDPGLEHWKAVKCILKYLRRTKDLLLVYGGSSLKIKGYSDSSFQVPSEDNIADPLTKPLTQNVFERHRGLMGIRHIGDWL
ncbi:unnamed protein product [Musa textilis]